MSDSTKLMASPDEVEEPAVAPSAGGETAPAAQDEAPQAVAASEQDDPVVGAGVEPAAEVRGAFGTQEYTSVGDDPARGATAGQDPVAAADAASDSAAGEAAAPADEAIAGEAAVPEGTVAEAAGAATGATEADAPLPAAEAVAGAPAAGAAAAAEAEGAAAPPPQRPRGGERKPRPTPAVAAGDISSDDEAGEGEGDGTEPAGTGLAALKRARDERRSVEGRVFGWNPGGFHVVIDGIAAFCPRSEMELEPIADPESYLDKSFQFRILKIQGKGRRIVVSRTALLREEHDKTTASTLQQLRAGAVIKGKVASLTDFGAFVDIGGVEGLVHVSEISQRRVAKPSDVLQVGQEVEVKVLKVERGGRRVSLSMKALEPDPWREVKEKYPEGAVVTGKVERTGPPGAFIELEPGLVGLLPTSEMGLPREAIPARAYPAGKEVKVQVTSVDPRRHRIALAPEGSRVEGTRGDYAAFLKQQQRDEDVGFKPFAAALQKLKPKK